MWPWKQFNWGMFWAVLAALIAWQLIRWAFIALLALLGVAVDKAN